LPVGGLEKLLDLLADRARSVFGDTARMIGRMNSLKTERNVAKRRLRTLSTPVVFVDAFKSRVLERSLRARGLIAF
jgi:hypothetical protein